MKVDHGITIPLSSSPARWRATTCCRYSSIARPIPRPSFRRVRAFGAAIGEFLAGQDMRITVVGSGGLSHDPPTPRLEQSPPERGAAADRRAHADARGARCARKPGDHGGARPGRRQGPLPAAERAMGPRFPASASSTARLEGFDSHDRRRDRPRRGLRRPRGAHLGRRRRLRAQRMGNRARSCATTIWCRSGSPAWASSPGRRERLNPASKANGGAERRRRGWIR